MTKQVNDDDMNEITGGAGAEHVFPKLDRILARRTHRAGTPAPGPTPGGPGPGAEADGHNDGYDNLVKK